MDIQESDFKIINDGNQFILYLIKSKKDLGEDNFKLKGYYTTLSSALEVVRKFRKDKKYPGKESSSEIEQQLMEYKKIESNFKKDLLSIYTPILNFQKSLL